LLVHFWALFGTNWRLWTNRGLNSGENRGQIFFFAFAICSVPFSSVLVDLMLATVQHRATKLRHANVCRLAVAALGFALPLGVLATAFAQSSPPRTIQAERSKDTSKLDAIRARDIELEAIRAQQKQSAETEATLKREIAAIGDDRRKLNQALIDTAARLRNLEGRIAQAENRLTLLEDSERAMREKLAGRRNLIAEVLAALQRIGRHPPVAVVVTAEDALSSVRTAIMLGAVLPEMRGQAEKLATELTALVDVRKNITEEQNRLLRDLAALAGERARTTRLIEERQKKQTETEKALEAERTLVSGLARQADNLKDLIGKLEHGLDRASRAARALENQRNNDSRPEMAAFKDPGRLAPAVAFATMHGQLLLPVNGVRTREFGAPDAIGGTEKGLSITTKAGAQVTSPCDGWVVYASPFRNYGQVLILDAGGGYHVVLSGMDRISVGVGQFVLTGEPVAIMGTGSQVAASVTTGSSQSVLYVEFRKDGAPIDPSPWWATSEGEKVRG
jgi:murein hydrolase activator